MPEKHPLVICVPVPRGDWLRVERASLVRIRDVQGAVVIYEVRPLPASVKHRRKRRRFDRGGPPGQ